MLTALKIQRSPTNIGGTGVSAFFYRQLRPFIAAQYARYRSVTAVRVRLRTARSRRRSRPAAMPADAIRFRVQYRSTRRVFR